MPTGTKHLEKKMCNCRLEIYLNIFILQVNYTKKSYKLKIRLVPKCRFSFCLNFLAYFYINPTLK